MLTWLKKILTIKKMSIATYFIDNLPTVPGVYAQEFASGMAQYWLSYKERRDSCMNYEKKQDYLSERCYIMAVPADQFWHHSPAFKKTIAQTIQDLFKTEIVGLGGNYVKPEPLFLMVDSAGNRWPITVEDSKLYAYFPRLKTRYAMSTMLTIKQMDGCDVPMCVDPVGEWKITPLH